MSERTPSPSGATTVGSGAPAPTATAAVALVAPTARGGDGGESSAFDGAAGRLLDDLLATSGLTGVRVVRLGILDVPCQGNRDPRPDELARGVAVLSEQLQDDGAIGVICTLGGAVLQALTGDAAVLADEQGQARPFVLGGRCLHLLPLHHPAAALFTPALGEQLRRGLQQVPALLASELPAPPEPESGPAASPAAADEHPSVQSGANASRRAPDQPSLFDL